MINNEEYENDGVDGDDDYEEGYDDTNNNFYLDSDDRDLEDFDEEN